MTPAIPKGWRKLRVGVRPLTGDSYLKSNGVFAAFPLYSDFKFMPVRPGETIIRKIRK